MERGFDSLTSIYSFVGELFAHGDYNGLLILKRVNYDYGIIPKEHD